MERRDLIQLLGVGAVGSISGCAGVGDIDGDIFQQFFDDDTERTPTATPTTPTPTEPNAQTRIQVIQAQLKKTKEEQPLTFPTLHFEYEAAEFTDIPDRNFKRIIATPAEDVDGDRLQLVPNEIHPEELATRLRIVWGVGDTEQTTRDIAGTSVSFTGGEVEENAYLVGYLTQSASTAESDVVLAARATTLDDALALTGRFEVA